jgi:phenylpropionate dioxygenase-like ring-hydroxylating dioxygenase large terminal subunit
MAAAPTSARLTNMYLWILRNYDFDKPDQEFTDFTHTIMEQDRAVVESQRPEEIPIDLREELHLKVPDASGIAYRRLLAGIAKAAEFGP